MSDYPTCLSREEWQREWQRTDPQTVGVSIGLNEFAKMCNDIGRERREKWPLFQWSNARYVCHLEDALEQNISIPSEYLRSVSKDEFRFDALGFPKLRAAMQGVKNE